MFLPHTLPPTCAASGSQGEAHLAKLASVKDFNVYWAEYAILIDLVQRHNPAVEGVAGSGWAALAVSHNAAMKQLTGNTYTRSGAVLNDKWGTLTRMANMGLPSGASPDDSLYRAAHADLVALVSEAVEMLAEPHSIPGSRVPCE